MYRAARISLLLVAGASVLAAVLVACGWHEAVADRLGTAPRPAALATAPGTDGAAAPAAKAGQSKARAQGQVGRGARLAPTAYRVGAPKAARAKISSPGADFQAAKTPEQRFDRLIDGVLGLAVEELSERMQAQEVEDAEKRRDCEQRQEEARKRRQTMYEAFSEEK
ncbi:MAG: hypothetical protein A2V98_22600 [Planctomycetes bacterium RBG_16_64_12]|nr:MAG: hypothetical protein A2V98_22600 [Planctomycetes bacterium RBG_16_64_12]